jgi:hypothetical protein
VFFDYGERTPENDQDAARNYRSLTIPSKQLCLSVAAGLQETAAEVFDDLFVNRSNAEVKL